MLVQEGSPADAFGGSPSTPRDSANHRADFPKTKGGGRNELCSLVAQAMRAEATVGGLEWIERAPAEAERRFGSNNAALMGPPSPLSQPRDMWRRRWAWIEAFRRWARPVTEFQPRSPRGCLKPENGGFGCSCHWPGKKTGPKILDRT